MKNWKKILCLVLVLALFAALSACGSLEPRLMVGMQRMAKLESLHSDTVLTAQVTLKMMDMETPMTLEVRASGDHQREPASNLFDLSLSLPELDFTQSLMVYIRSGEDATSFFTSWDEGRNWVGQMNRKEASEAPETSEEAAAETTPALNAGDLLKAAMGVGSYFTEVENPEDEGNVVYEGVLPAELVQELLLTLDTSSLKELLPDGVEPDLSAMAADIPVVLTLDKDNSMVTRVEMDLTACAVAAADSLLQAILGELDLPASSISLEISTLRIVTELSRFDSASFVLPAVPEV